MPILNRVLSLFGQTQHQPFVVAFAKRAPGRLTELLSDGPFEAPPVTDFRSIEKRAADTERLGAQPLWEGYRDVVNYPHPTRDSRRSSNQVRSSAVAGRFFSWLATRCKPDVVVEFGTAFGVSGMYWLAGLEQNRRGRLLTFDPNETWARIAEKNLAAVSTRFQLTIGTFEDNVDNTLRPGEKIDIAFVDAIHTGEFVFRQFEILLPRMSDGGLILFDDIAFSEDMAQCWNSLAVHRRALASASFGGHVGILELSPPVRGGPG